jgi:hypothetical protein
MSRFLALAPPELYASALRVPWPADPLEQVRCLDAGTRALGLATTCAPWSADAEDAALADELDLPKGTSAGFDPLDEVTTWLGATPAAPPIFGLISGPAHWSGRVSDHPDALDIAADLAAGRVRALAAAGVERVVVIERMAPQSDQARVADAHETILRAARHLQLDVLLVLEGDTTTTDALGYADWVSLSGASPGRAYLAPAALESSAELTNALTTRADLHEVVTGLLRPQTSPDRVRQAVSAVSAMGALR